MNPIDPNTQIPFTLPASMFNTLMNILWQQTVEPATVTMPIINTMGEQAQRFAQKQQQEAGPTFTRGNGGFKEAVVGDAADENHPR
jgi:hypothetical protein